MTTKITKKYFIPIILFYGNKNVCMRGLYDDLILV